MRNFVLATALATTLALSSCGGGGGSGGNAAPNPSGATTTPTPSTTTTDGNDGQADQASNTPSNARGTATLRIDPEFDVKSSWKMSVVVNLPGSAEAFFSLCSGFTELDQGFDVDFETCILRSPISNGTLEGTVEVSNQYESLVGALIYFDEFVSPEYQLFRVENGQPYLRWE